MPGGALAHCAFCGCSQHEVGYLVVAQRQCAAICADCLADATKAMWAAGVPVPRADGGGVGFYRHGLRRRRTSPSLRGGS